MNTGLSSHAQTLTVSFPWATDPFSIYFMIHHLVELQKEKTIYNTLVNVFSVSLNQSKRYQC